MISSEASRGEGETGLSENVSDITDSSEERIAMQTAPQYEARAGSSGALLRSLDAVSQESESDEAGLRLEHMVTMPETRAAHAGSSSGLAAGCSFSNNFEESQLGNHRSSWKRQLGGGVPTPQSSIVAPQGPASPLVDDPLATVSAASTAETAPSNSSIPSKGPRHEFGLPHAVTPTNAEREQSLRSHLCSLSSMGRAGSTRVVDVRSPRQQVRTDRNGVAATVVGDILTGRDEVHRFVQRGDTDEGALQWLQALELQVMGACRADERLRPLLRWNVSCFGADGRLLAHLGQHFKARELALLARCLCAPLVSLRVGKVLRHGHHLRPTTTRGYLSLTLLPCSEMRISFIGDSGIMERIAVISSSTENGSVLLEELTADASGRSFMLKLPGDRLTFFWQSEKSKAVGDELVYKMKDLLKRRPTLAQLTGIHESRLDSFASYLCSALLATSPSQSGLGQSSVPVPMPLSTSSTNTTPRNTSSSPSPSSNPSLCDSPPSRVTTLSPLSSQFTRMQLPAHSQSTAWIEGSLIARSGGLKNVSTKVAAASMSQSIGSSREKQRRRLNDSFCSKVPSHSSPCSFSNGCTNGCNLPTSLASGGTLNTSWSTRISHCQEKMKGSSHCAGLYTSLQPDPQVTRQERIDWSPDVTHGCCSLPIAPLPQSLFPFPSFAGEPSPNPFLPPGSSYIPLSTSSLLSPYYCPCPLGTAALQYTYAPPYLPTTLSDSSFIPPATPFFSIRPPPAVLPPSSLGVHELSLLPVQLPSSPLVTAPIPFRTSDLSPSFSDPISQIPLLNLPIPNKSYLVQAPTTAATHLAAGFPRLPDCLRTHFLSQTDAQLSGRQEEVSPLNLFRCPSSGMSSSWEAFTSSFGKLSPCSVHSESILSRGRAPSFITSVSDVREIEGADGMRMSGDVSAQSINLRCGAYQKGLVGPVLDNMVHINLPPQQTGPMLALVPAVAATTNISHVLSFRPDLVSQGGPTLASGHLDLYDSATELGGSLHAAHANGASRRVTTSRDVAPCWTPVSQVISCDPAHTPLQLDPKSLAESSSRLYEHRTNDEERPK